MISDDMADCPLKLYRMGDRYQKKGALDKARACYEQAVGLKHDFVEAHFKLAILFADCGQWASASAAYKTCIQIEPKLAAAYNNLGLILRRQGNVRSAISCFRKCISINPEFSQAYINLGAVLKTCGQLDAALELYLGALRINPKDAILYYNLGMVRKDLGQLDDALSCFEKAAALRPGFSQTLNNAGIVLRKMGRTEEAIKQFRKAVDVDPGNAEACYNLGKLLQDICEWRKIEQALDRIDRQTRHSVLEGGQPAEEPFFNLVRSQDLGLNLQVSRSHSQKFAGRLPKNSIHRTFHKFYKKSERLTVGYLSDSFNNHPTAHLIYDIFRRHDRGRIIVHCYSYGRDDRSTYRKNIQTGSDRFVDISDMTSSRATDRIREDQVDILVDLKGHTSSSRLGICAARPAPLQVRYLGMAGTTGASFFDYIVTDPIVTPLDHAPYYSEKLVHMPHSYQVNSPKNVASEDRYRDKSMMGLPEKGTVLAAFLAGYKIDRLLFDKWVAILNQAHGSVLWLWERDPQFKRNIIREARQRSLDPDRIVFAQELSKPEHLARLSLADLCLDTRAVNGAATTSDALWAGVPVVTIRGRHFASRMSASILTAVGLEELITDDLQQYEKLAVALATDGKRLKALREKLGRNKHTYPLFDTRRFVRNLENAYEQMWAIYKSGKEPRHIQVKDSGPSANYAGAGH